MIVGIADLARVLVYTRQSGLFTDPYIPPRSKTHIPDNGKRTTQESTKIEDRYGLPITTSSTAAANYLVEGLDLALEQNFAPER